MIRQFVRLYLTVMIPVMVLIGLAHHYGTHAATHAAYVEGLRTGLGSSYAPTRDRIGALKLDDWAASLPQLRAGDVGDLRFDLAPVAFAKLRSDRGESARFENGEVAFAINRRGTSHAYQRIPGTPLTVGSDLVIPSDDDVSPTLYLLIALAAASGVVLWLWFHPSWTALERLGRLTERVAPSAGRQPALDGGRRLGQPFATSIDRVSSRLGDLLEVRRAHSNSVAHELTAPIGQLSFALELLKERPDSPDAPTLLAGMREDLRALDELVTESLDVARLERRGTLDVDDASVSELMRSAVVAAGRLPRHDRRITSIDLPGDADRVRCDRRQMNRALSNLIRNAVRHADSTIVVHAEAGGGKTWIHVDDDGPGVPDAERERLFAPFERGGAGASTPGWGLGLAIVRQVAALHGGVTRIDRSPFGGARFSIGW